MSVIKLGLTFQRWTYAITIVTFISQVLLLKSDLSATACLDTRCDITFVDKAWFLRQLFGQKIKEMSISLKVKGIKTLKYKSAQFPKVFLFLSGTNVRGQQVYTSFKYKLHLAERLRANILVRNDILASEGFILNLKISHALVKSCGVTIPIKVRQKSQFLKKKLLAKIDKVVLPCSETIIPLFPIPLLNNQNFLFHPVV